MTHTESGLGPLMRATPFARLVILAVIGCCWIFLLSGMGMGDIKNTYAHPYRHGHDVVGDDVGDDVARHIAPSARAR